MSFILILFLIVVFIIGIVAYKIYSSLKRSFNFIPRNNDSFNNSNGRYDNMDNSGQEIIYDRDNITVLKGESKNKQKDNDSVSYGTDD